MKKKVSKKVGYKVSTEIIKFIIVVLVFLAIITAIYYFFFYPKTCLDRRCFSVALGSCERAEWINDAEEASWFYNIKGKEGTNCVTEVKLLLVKKGNIEIEEIEGESMICQTPLGSAVSPEQNLERCSGELKEDLQKIVIQRMHSYILKNIGEVSEELVEPL